MKLDKTIIPITIFLFFYSCADYKQAKKIPEKKFYSSFGFALIYDENLKNEKIVNKRISNEKLEVIHNSLKRNTPIKIINPKNSKFVETKVYKTGIYPKIFNIVISKKIASILELDLDNPYIEIIEVKKNKTFVAKKTNTFEEEKNVVEKAPVDEIKMDDLSQTQDGDKAEHAKESYYTLVVSDFYYQESAINLRNELIKKTGMDNISVKKINNNKYRLFIGPFKNFNALKTTYISLNNLGFENLNVHRE